MRPPEFRQHLSDRSIGMFLRQQQRGIFSEYYSSFDRTINVQPFVTILVIIVYRYVATFMYIVQESFNVRQRTSSPGRFANSVIIWIHL